MNQLRAILPLKPTFQNYNWGKIGEASLVRRLIKGEPAASSEMPFAELWLGAHPHGDSMVTLESLTAPLSEIIKQHPEQVLGERVLKKFGVRLPFLFKVLSTAKPLSIQLHPDEQHAERLFSAEKSTIADQFAKREIAVALSNSSLLYGARKLASEDCAIFGGGSGDKILGELLSSSSAHLKDYSDKLVSAVDSRRKKGADLSPNDQTFLELLSVFGEEDRGVLVSYLMNVVQLRSGEAIYTEALMPHAYLTGDFVECLSCSDNIIRAGLTAKNTDTKTFSEIGNFKPLNPLLCATEVICAKPNTQKFLSPASEFQLWRITGDGVLDLSLEKDNLGPQLIFCLSGAGKIYNKDSNSSEVPLFFGEAALLPSSSSKGFALSISHGDFFRVAVG